MKILLTGSTGFIGRHLCRYLVDAGHAVAAPGRDGLMRYQERYDAVIDLAWGGVQACHRNNWEFQTENVARFGRTLAMLPIWKPSVFIGFGSQAEYGDNADRSYGFLYSNNQPKCAYGQAKKACCSMLETAGRFDGFRSIWFRLFSVYGPGERDGWLIPSTIRKMKSGERLLFTAGEQQMDYLHVTDLCRSISACLANEKLPICWPTTEHYVPSSRRWRKSSSQLSHWNSAHCRIETANSCARAPIRNSGMTAD